MSILKIRGLLIVFFSILNLLLFQNCSQFVVSEDGVLENLHSEHFYSLADSSSGASLVKSETDIDLVASDCMVAVLSGFKCLDQRVSTSEGKSYGIRIKWNRIGQTSRGSFISVGGGTGKGEALEDETFKALVHKLDKEDQVRAIFLEFTDEPRVAKDWGGCWSQGGGYRSAGLLFQGSVRLIVEQLKIPRGSFLNYLGLSNGTMLISYGMSNLDMDKYFDRVVMHAGPVMADASEACNHNNSKSIFVANTKEKSDYLFNLFSTWLNGDGGAHMCSNINSDDRMSVLNGRRNFSNTHIHTVIGAYENKTGGFGNYHLVSNEDWFNKVSAKTKQRIVADRVGHLYSYKDLRRFLKLDRNQTASADTDCPETVYESCESGTLFQYAKLTCTHPLQDAVMSGAGWSKVAEKQYRVSTGQACGAPIVTAKSFKFSGYFYGNGRIITRRDHVIEGGGPNMKVCLGRNSVSLNACVAESEFVFMKDRMGAQGSYNAAADIYYVRDNDMTASAFPYEKYYSVFILSDGSRKRIELSPVYESAGW